MKCCVTRVVLLCVCIFEFVWVAFESVDSVK